jgi:hypothetical protein
MNVYSPAEIREMEDLPPMDLDDDLYFGGDSE